MITNVIMESIDRELCGRIVRQRTKDSFMALADVLAIGKLYRLQNNIPDIDFSVYLRTQNVKEFLAELERETGTNPYIKNTKSKTGWIHPFFAIKILTHYNPKFEVQVYKWLWDFLIQHRIEGGDSYNTMCGVLWKYARNKANFSNAIRNCAKTIKELIGCDDWNQATQEQLKNRDLLHNYITDATRTIKDSTQGFKLGCEMYKSRVEVEL